MEIDDDAKEIVREIGTAINESVENSTKVAEAIERLREAGYEMELTLRLGIHKGFCLPDIGVDVIGLY